MRERTPGGTGLDIATINAGTVDEAIERMSARPMREVVCVAESANGEPRLTVGTARARTAADYLVARLFTDAVFSEDIRSIQLIINRIDGGLPKDVDVARYRTSFGDCLNAVMAMSSADQVKVDPDDTVMMALCKSLFQIAVQDIYWDEEKGRRRRPSDAQKKERDAALRMVLERAGGRKTLTDVPAEAEDVEIAGWISDLPKLTC